MPRGNPGVARINQKQTPRNFLRKIDDELFTAHVTQSTTWNELGAKCGYKMGKHSDPTNPHVIRTPSLCTIHKTNIQTRIKQLNLSDEHIHDATPGPQMKVLSLLKSRKRKTDKLRRMLDESGRLYICDWCKCDNMTLKNGEWLWRDKPLTLQIDHIHGRDGDDQDRLDNLRYLCPNCHCQTANWGGKGRKRLTIA